MGPNVATSLQNLEAVETKQQTKRPTKPSKEDSDEDPSSLVECQLNYDDHREERKQANKKKEHLEMGLRQACFVIKGQCTPTIAQKLEGNKDYEDVHSKQDAIGMLKLIKNVNCKFKDQKVCTFENIVTALRGMANIAKTT